MRGVGIDDELLRPISLLPAWTQVLVYTTTLTGSEIGRVRRPDFESKPIADSPSMPHMSSQEKVELVLRNLADENELIDFRVGTTVHGLAQTSHRCELAIESATGKTETVAGEYVLFADGAMTGLAACRTQRVC